MILVSFGKIFERKKAKKERNDTARRKGELRLYSFVQRRNVLYGVDERSYSSGEDAQRRERGKVHAGKNARFRGVLRVVSDSDGGAQSGVARQKAFSEGKREFDLSKIAIKGKNTLQKEKLRV